MFGEQTKLELQAMERMLLEERAKLRKVDSFSPFFIIFFEFFARRPNVTCLIRPH